MEPTKPNDQTPTPDSPVPDSESAPLAPTTPESTPAVSAPQPTAPEATGPVVGGADQAQTTAPVSSPVSVSSGPGGKKKWLLPVAIAVLVVLLAGGYVFGMYLPNRPDAVYSKSLSNTGKAVDSLVDYSNNLSEKNYKSYALNGTMKVKSGSGSFDGTLKGSFDEKANADVTVSVDALGQKLSADVRSLHVSGNTTPDIYVKLSGIKTLLASYGASSLSSLDGQWISIDHTLIDTATASLKESISTDTSSLPTPDQIHDALVKVQTVNKDYLFSTDPSKVVLKQDKYVGKETKDGRSVYHYKVSVDNAHTKAYGEALKKALDSSSLNDWYKKANEGKNISSSLDTSSLDGTNTTKLDLWADTKTKLIHAIQFSDSSNPDSVGTLTQNYTGGDEYPFAIDTVDKSGGQTNKLHLALSINKKTDVATLKLTGNEGSSEYSLDMKVTPSNSAVQVTAPSGAQPVTNVLNQLGLGSSL